MKPSPSCRSPILPHPVLKVWLLVLLSAVSQAFAQNPNAARPLQSLQSILTSNGRIKASATSGSYDAHGYHMTIGSDGSPGFSPAASDPHDANWDPSFILSGLYFGSGQTGFVNALAAYRDSLLLIGGYFAGGGTVITANSILAYDLSTNRWVAFDSTSPNHGIGAGFIVNSIALIGNDVFIGGSFSAAGTESANNIVDYNMITGTWTTLGPGPANGTDGQVNALVNYFGFLCVGGQFASAGGDSASNIALWDGFSWHTLGSGVDNAVSVLAVDGNDLYAGGTFHRAGGSPANCIAKWNGTNWSPVGNSPYDVSGATSVHAILPVGHSLYVGGTFNRISSDSVANALAKWDGASWSAVGKGVTGTVLGLAYYGGKLLVSGTFNAGNFVTFNNIALVDTAGKTWAQFGSGSTIGADNVARNPLVARGKLYLPGNFTTIAGTVCPGIASWDGTNISSLGKPNNAPGGPVYALALSGNNLYIGGAFKVAGIALANNVAVYNTGTHAWSSLGSGNSNGVLGTVQAIAVSGTNVYVGGGLNQAGGSQAHGLAMWDGAKWSVLGSPPNDGVDGGVNALSAVGSDLYVGGAFAHAGGVSAGNIAKWSAATSTWSVLGSGVNNPVEAIAPGRNEIYVGGNFTSAGGAPASYIASWNGANWTSLGSPTNGTNSGVFALATNADTAYAGGEFTNAGGRSAGELAEWNAPTWTAMGAGVNDQVHALNLNPPHLYIGGRFSRIGTNPTGPIVDWNIYGNTFSTLGDGFNSDVYAIASSGNDVYIGGYFTSAGGKPSYRLGRYNSGAVTGIESANQAPTSFHLLQNYPNPFNPSTTIMFQLATAGFVSLKIFDLLGREVETLVQAMREPGIYTLRWNASRVGSGVYFYRLQSGSEIETRKLTVLK